jgi:hypothetical protein
MPGIHRRVEHDVPQIGQQLVVVEGFRSDRLRHDAAHLVDRPPPVDGQRRQPLEELLDEVAGAVDQCTDALGVDVEAREWLGASGHRAMEPQHGDRRSCALRRPSS